MNFVVIREATGTTVARGSVPGLCLKPARRRKGDQEKKKKEDPFLKKKFLQPIYQRGGRRTVGSAPGRGEA